MRLLVCSDIHGRGDRIQTMLRLHPTADALLFLGDGIHDLPDSVSASPRRLFAGVRGNCDPSWTDNSDFSLSHELLLSMDAYTVMMMHGHLYNVKSGTDTAICHAARRGADILLYGHTHIAEERYLPQGTKIGEITLTKPLWIMNPGSLGAPLDGRPSYGIIELRGNGVLLSHGTVE